MKRKIVFTAGNGDVLTLDGNPYLLTSVEGLGTPSTNLQQQKSPFQDGTTHIDALLQNRELVLEIGINKPNDFSGIDLARRELSKKLNPKNGPGVLIYTTENGTEYRLECVPVSSPVFANKLFMEPFLKCQVTFSANNPFWLKTTTSTATLPKPVLSAESVIDSTHIFGCSIIQKSDGHFACVYVTSDFGGMYWLKYRSSVDGISWTTAVDIIATHTGLIYSPCIIQRANTTLLVSYLRTPSTTFLEFATAPASGATWTVPPTTVDAGVMQGASTCEALDGRVYFSYDLAGAVKERNTFDLSAFSSAVTIAAAGSYPKIKTLSNGSLICAYSTSPGIALAAKESPTAGPWIYQGLIGSGGGCTPVKVLGQSTSALTIVYLSASGLRYVQNNGSNWFSPCLIFASVQDYADAITVTNGIRFIYGKPSTLYLATKTRKITPVDAANPGDVETPCTIVVNGPAVNPRIEVPATGEYIRLKMTILTGDVLTVNTGFGEKTISLTQSGIVKNGIQFLDLGSTFFSLQVGSNVVYLDADEAEPVAVAAITWRERFVGI